MAVVAHTYFTWGAIILGICAALTWFGATLAVREVDQKSMDFIISETDERTGKEVNVLETAKLQTKWNRWAAIVTALSVLSQALAQISQEISN